MDRVTKQTRRWMIALDKMSRQMIVQTNKGGELVRNRADVRVMPMSDISKMADEHSISKEAHQKVQLTKEGLHLGGCPPDRGGTANPEGPVTLEAWLEATQTITHGQSIHE